MAASVSIAQVIEVLDLAGGDEGRIVKFTSSSTPVETVQGKPIISNTAYSIDLGDIAAGKGFILYIESLVGNTYVKLGATTGDPASTDSHLYIPEGEGYIIPINPNATAMAGIRVINDEATTGQIKYILIGKA